MADFHNLSKARAQREGLPPVRFLDGKEETALFAALRTQSEVYYSLSIFLLDTGARIGEATALKWASVAEQCVTFEQGKTTIKRTIPLTKRAARVMAGQRENGDGPYVSVRLQAYRAAWKNAKHDAGIFDANLVPTVLRHTCAVRLVKGGVDLRTVQKWLGHRSLAMTMRYAQFAETDLEACVRVLER
ncbi:site-specific integrase [Aminobacter sp. P9b]|uniref:site-specific integrase n=1 Tax=Aminobacter sp. P9b TaxID=3133697 RepID=UPI00324F3BFF